MSCRDRIISRVVKPQELQQWSISTYLISKSCISCRVRVLATSSSCRMFSSRRLASASGCSRIVAAGASNDKDGCCTTIVAWVDRLLPPLPPFGYEKFTIRYPVFSSSLISRDTNRRKREPSLSLPRPRSRVSSHSALAECISGILFRPLFFVLPPRQLPRRYAYVRCVWWRIRDCPDGTAAPLPVNRLIMIFRNNLFDMRVESW